MKICHVINSLSGGGAETHLLDLVHAQKDQGHTVTVIATGPDKKNMKSLEEEFTNVSDNVLRLYFPRLFNLYSYIKLKEKILKKINMILCTRIIQEVILCFLF